MRRQDLNPTGRFSPRVEAYANARPGYPMEMIDLLRREIGLQASWTVADLGSGTGLSARPFLEAGHLIWGVEPNAEMRRAGEEHLRPFANFRSIEGTAEATTLADRSVDLVIAGQAFHWFDAERARDECRRILRVPGWAALIWNCRLTSGTAFLEGYEALLRRWATDYEDIRQGHAASEELARFFGREAPRKLTLRNSQEFDLDGLIERAMSSSYVPLPDHPNHGPLMEGLRDLFARATGGGAVQFLYETEIHVGQLNP